MLFYSFKINASLAKIHLYVQYIVIDNIPSRASVTILSKAEVLDQPELLNTFKCRTPGPVKRSQ